MGGGGIVRARVFRDWLNAGVYGWISCIPSIDDALAGVGLVGDRFGPVCGMAM
jgi:hypothetical protein